jgi:hypothetical protein
MFVAPDAVGGQSNPQLPDAQHRQFIRRIIRCAHHRRVWIGAQFLIVNVPTSELGAAMMRHNYSAVDQRYGVGAFEKYVVLNTPDFVGGYTYAVPNGTGLHPNHSNTGNSTPAQ